MADDPHLPPDQVPSDPFDGDAAPSLTAEAEDAPLPYEQDEAGFNALSEALQIGFKFLRWLMILVIFGYLASGIFIVKQDEKAFVLLLGKISGLGEDKVKSPGLHWTWPRPFSEIIRVTAERVETAETDTFWFKGMGAMSLEEAMGSGRLRPENVRYSLTADASIIHSRWKARYTINDAEAWAFGFSGDPKILLRQALDQAIVQASARYKADDALRKLSKPFQGEIERRLRSRCSELKLGVEIQGVDRIVAIPPPQTTEAFADVIAAESESGTVIEEAKAYASNAINAGEGDAERIRELGKQEKNRIMLDLEAEAKNFESLLVQYKAQPEITRNNLRQSAVQDALSQKLRAKYTLFEKSDGTRELRLNFGERLKTPKL